MQVKITETAFRDAHQSLMATRFKTEDMIPILEKMDQMGYWSFEMWGGATFDTALRYIKQSPWDRIREFKKIVKNTHLQMLLRGQNLVGYRHYGDDILERFVKKAFDLGIDVFRIFDALNDVRNMEKAIETAKKCGAIVQGAVNYTISPVHTLDSFVNVGKQLKTLGVDIICIKDMAGLISPTAAYNLVSKMKKEIKLPVCLHSHCSAGLAPISYYAAAQAGVDHLDTAISPLSQGTSQPTTESIVEALRETNTPTAVKEEYFPELVSYFNSIREKYSSYWIDLAERVDVRALIYQVPGGMFSNLVSQLEKQDAMDKFEDVLKEIPKVREELGWVPLVTPTSQIVGTQAAMNVLLGERYKVVIKEVKDLCKGFYGRTPAPIDPKIKKLAIGDEKVITGRPAEAIGNEWEKMKKEIESITQEEEDILSYALFPQPALDYFEYRKNPLQQKEKSEKDARNLFVPQNHPSRKFVISVDGEDYEVGVTEVGHYAYDAYED
ncbi:pyruvate carboxylase subunit B [candidate division WOR-3 bacterium]|nr:pyruvate carboxylase subunit B [candidate division WOR-3 bacterium]